MKCCRFMCFVSWNTLIAKRTAADNTQYQPINVSIKGIITSHYAWLLLHCLACLGYNAPCTTNPHVQENGTCQQLCDNLKINVLYSVCLICPGWIASIPFEMTSIIVNDVLYKKRSYKRIIVSYSVMLMLINAHTCRGRYVHMGNRK